MKDFNSEIKKQIEKDIEKDFIAGYKGILELPRKAKFGVYMAYKYYFKLFKKIKSTEPNVILNERVRLANYRKARILLTSIIRLNLNRL